MRAGWDSKPVPDGTEVRFKHSPSLPEALAAGGCSLLVSTYQAGQLVSIGTIDRELSFDFRRFDGAMGVAVASDRIAVASRDQVWFLRDHSDLAPQLPPVGGFDRCFLPRSTVVTGRIQAHELTWGADGELWLVNTLFSCLAGVDPAHSFVPRWRPPFITELAGQDRCHLNGLAMRDGVPAYVTVMARSDEPAGWREHQGKSGAILDVASGEAVTTGLAMPHSPRWHEGALFVLNSGFGRLEHVDLRSGHREVVAMLPGYARGLSIHNGLAYIGLSRIRETAVFGATPIALHHNELKCGIGVIELSSGNTVATLQFENGVEEIFDVQVVAGARCVSLGGAPGSGGEVWIVPRPDPAAALGRAGPMEPRRAGR